MGDGRGDFQRAWHEHAGRMFSRKTILDVGAAIGLSRERLANGGQNVVTTQDIGRSLMLSVDVICEIGKMRGAWDVVTAFDVVEHAPDAAAFLADLVRLALEGVLLTTPNHALYPHPWHFTAAEVEGLAVACLPTVALRWFARYHEGERDEIVEVPRETFHEDATIYAFGIYLAKQSASQSDPLGCQ